VVLFMSLFLAREAFRPIDRVEKEFHAAYAGQTAAPAILKLLSEKPSIVEASSPVAPPARADVEFADVTFSYDGRAPAPALKSVSFVIQPDQRIALVGPSGAGKSTVIALLLRFFEAQSGAVRVGGVDVKDMSLDALRSTIAVVAQEPSRARPTPSSPPRPTRRRSANSSAACRRAMRRRWASAGRSSRAVSVSASLSPARC
jgi:ATP-binding cassette subfamily C protein CydCD